MAEANNTAQITRQDVQQALSIHGDMLKMASKYYRKVLELSQASVEFATSLEAVAKCKGAEQGGQGLLSAAELHRLMAKHHDQLADSIHKEFELPLQRNLTSHQKRTEENERAFDKNMRKMQDDISKTENKMLKGRKKDLAVFQQSLKDMQRQAEELEIMKDANAARIMSDEQNHVMFLVQKAAGMVKSEYDHFSALAALSRDATEEIITIAFTPAHSTLDQEQKKRVVEKYLGSSGSPNLPESRRDSQASSVVSAVPAPVTSLPAINTRAVTPPVTPQPVASFSRTSSSGVIRRMSQNNMSPAIQDSLKRLNVAAANASSQQSGPISPMSTKTSRADSSTSSAVGAVSSGGSKALDKVEEEQTGIELVVAVHDFKARSERELSFSKGEVLLVKQRQENWLYCCHNDKPGSKSGWVPVSYTQKK